MFYIETSHLVYSLRSIIYWSQPIPLTIKWKVDLLAIPNEVFIALRTLSIVIYFLVVISKVALSCDFWINYFFSIPLPLGQ